MSGHTVPRWEPSGYDIDAEDYQGLRPAVVPALSAL